MEESQETPENLIFDLEVKLRLDREFLNKEMNLILESTADESLITQAFEFNPFIQLFIDFEINKITSDKDQQKGLFPGMTLA